MRHPRNEAASWQQPRPMRSDAFRALTSATLCSSWRGDPYTRYRLLGL